MLNRFWAPVMLLGLAAGCSTSPPSGVTPVSGFDVDRYLGKWYEIARLDHRFERGLSQVTAEYTLNDNGTVRVLNRGYDASTGEWESAEGRAMFRGDEDIGSLKVSFFGPFYGGYHVIELGDEYEYALVAGPSKKYLWILSRTPALDKAAYDRLVKKASDLGFPTGELVTVVHPETNPDE